MQYRARVRELTIQKTIQNSKLGLKEMGQRQQPGQQEEARQRTRKFICERHNGSYKDQRTERTPYVGKKWVSLWAEQSEKGVRTNTEARDEQLEGELYQKLESNQKMGRMQRGSTGGNPSKVKYSGLEES